MNDNNSGIKPDNRQNTTSDKNPLNNGGKRSFAERLAGVKTTRWIRFGIVSVLFFLWVVWMGNPWLALIWLPLADIYITGYIPWGWWKNKKGATRSIMAWVDAIIYALVLVYLIFAFVGQNYKIPSSSLEKSLLVGDYLWVNKTLYGPRVPQTPLHFPLAQHTLPIINTRSYIESPSLGYHRLPGIRQIKRGDIVVFNYPQGDTVATKIQNPDYYQIVHDLRAQGIGNPQEFIRQNPQTFGEVIWRPVDRRENYVKRAIGLPGDRLRISGDTVYINGVAMENPDNVQFNYIIPVNGRIPDEKWKEAGVRYDDHGDAPAAAPPGFGFNYYNVPLTADMKAQVETWPEVIGPLTRESESGLYNLSCVFPLDAGYGWTRDRMGEIWLPKRGSTLRLTLNNLPVYERAIRVYEGNDLQVRDGKIYINGKDNPYYTFRYDYYWMMGDNRDRSADSRYWGLVPEDHIVGSPMFVIVSFDEERSLTEGKIRWNRILSDANPDSGKWK